MTSSDISVFFSDTEEYDPRRPQAIDQCGEAQDIQDYAFQLLGDSPSGLKLIDYARRLLDASVIVDDWKHAEDELVATMDAIKKMGSDRTVVATSLRQYVDAKYPTLHINFVADCSNLCVAIAEFCNKRLRRVFGDPDGRYVLEWNDFCRTGAPLVLHPNHMRRAAVRLLNMAEEVLA